MGRLTLRERGFSLSPKGTDSLWGPPSLPFNGCWRGRWYFPEGKKSMARI